MCVSGEDVAAVLAHTPSGDGTPCKAQVCSTQEPSRRSSGQRFQPPRIVRRLAQQPVPEDSIFGSAAVAFEQTIQ